MGKWECSYIDAGIGTRRQVERMFREAKEAGCTVSYNKRSGLVNTIYEDIKIEGPDHIVRRIHRIVSDASGRLV